MKQQIFESGSTYHLYNRGNNKENIFIEDKNYFYFLTLIKKHILPVADVYAYCLLKNHFHIVIRIKDIDDLPEKYKDKIYLPFSNLFNSYSKSINTAYDRTGSLFQEHLKRNKINDEDYLKQLIIYTHLNPVKHNFSNDFKKYPHSSFGAYMSDKESSVKREYVLDFFGGIENFEFCHVESQIKYENIIAEIDLMDE